jgi:hypothetical protein
MEWIDVNDALPKDEEQVIVLARCINTVGAYPSHDLFVLSVFEAEFNRKTGWYVYFRENNSMVYYWMPLPEKPDVR